MIIKTDKRYVFKLCVAGDASLGFLKRLSSRRISSAKVVDGAKDKGMRTLPYNTIRA